ncbi:MAG: protein MnhE [Acidimicrobiia bacterium]|nr:protein MnhE [Acidimicrobiia bacterium]
MRRFLSTWPSAAALFAFWVLLSGKLDAAHLTAGVVSAAVIAVAASRLWALPPTIGSEDLRPFRGLHWGPALAYPFWLAWEVLLSSVAVARLVLHPRMPIAPELVRIRPRLPHLLARLTLANSITLTPGTVTLDVSGSEFLVHALTPASAGSLKTGSIQRRIAGLFQARDDGPEPEARP